MRKCVSACVCEQLYNINNAVCTVNEILSDTHSKMHDFESCRLQAVAESDSYRWLDDMYNAIDMSTIQLHKVGRRQSVDARCILAECSQKGKHDCFVSTVSLC